ncbi:hypothetical protein GOBAR_AA16099 [Gossypium barbadense]|uniref:Uncharacterized protein n=1 Tax=Gossypium barbadense TaxID=3634 RepID=A0A2P5XMK2_GOSBA|nr:hypothetical protein GOBAR_AA16099 [Gossypium barbadense]
MEAGWGWGARWCIGWWLQGWLVTWRGMQGEEVKKEREGRWGFDWRNRVQERLERGKAGGGANDKGMG